MISKISSMNKLDQILIDTSSCINPKSVPNKNYLLIKIDFEKNVAEYAHFLKQGIEGYVRSFNHEGRRFIDYINFNNKEEVIDEEKYYNILKEIAKFYSHDSKHIFYKKHTTKIYIKQYSEQLETFNLFFDPKDKPNFTTTLKINNTYEFVDLKELLTN